MAEEKIPYNLPGNSNKKKAEEAAKTEKNLEQVTSGKVVERKKPLGRKIAETFAGDDAHTVGQYILFDVVIPAAKTMLSDAVSQGVERLLFGGGNRGGSPARSNKTYTSYNKMYTKPGGSSRELSYRAKAQHDFKEIILETRGEAENVVELLIELVNDYDVATVSDLYELVGVTGSFTDNKYGWTDLRTATVRRVREGYLLDLPNVQALD